MYLRKLRKTCAQGSPKRFPENLCETCTGALKDVQRSYKICAGVLLHKFGTIVWGGGLPRICPHTFRIFLTRLGLFNTTKLDRQMNSQPQTWKSPWFESLFWRVLRGLPKSPVERNMSLKVLNAFSLTAFKNALNQNSSQRLFWGVPVRGTGICQEFVKKQKR